MIPLLLRERHKVYRLLAPERVEGVGRGEGVGWTRETGWGAGMGGERGGRAWVTKKWVCECEMPARGRRRMRVARKSVNA